MKKLILILSLFTLFIASAFAQNNGNYQWILNQDGATTNQVLSWNGTRWAPANVSTGTVTSIAIAVPTGMGVSGSPITTSGTITLSLANDLLALEGLAANGYAVRVGTDTWAQRTLTGTSNRITVSNGDGTIGNPVFDISSSYVGQSSITTLGTITTGVWNGTAITVPNGGTGMVSGTSGGMPYFSSTTTLASSGLLTDNVLIVGGGAGTTPNSLASGLGTTTTLLHGNAAGEPTWGTVTLTTDVSGNLPVANGGTGITLYTVGDILYASATGTLSKLNAGTSGYVLTSNGPGTAPSYQAVAIGGGGTVTSFSAGNLSPLFTTSVATATSTPALSFTLTAAGANTYLGNATGSSASPSYTTAGALTKTDDTNVTLTLGGAPTTALLTAASLTLGWTGTLAATRGGTGTGTVTTGDLLYGSATNTWSKLADVATGSVLKSGGVGVAPAWGTLASTDLTNSSNIALLNATQTFTGTTNTFSGQVSMTNEVRAYTTVTTNTSTLTGTTTMIYLNVAVAGSTVTLPADANVQDGEIIELFNFNSNAIDILANGANQNINGGSQITDMPQYGHVVLHARIVSTTINWERWE